MINRFIGKYKALSNFEHAMVIYQHMAFPTVEHAYVAAKSRDVKFRGQIAAMSSKLVGQAKKWGRTITLRSDWEKVKLGIMEDLLIQKFSPEKKTLNIPNPHYEVLMSTGDQLLVEGNYWHDNYWGNCLCEKCMKIEGQNHLGLLLMKVREYYSLKDEGIINLEVTS